MRSRLAVFAVVASLLGAGCERPAESATSDAAADAPKAQPTPGKRRQGPEHMLGITGYNYTDRTIGSFSVNGAGGDILRVSSPTSGGSGTACCIVWHDGTKLPVMLRVEWVAESCLRRVTNRFGESRDALSNTYRETMVEFNGPVPDVPAYLEVHFYPDGRIAVEITDRDTEPRLKLDRSREREPGRCKDDAKP